MPFKDVYKGVTFPVPSTVMHPSSLATELNISPKIKVKLRPFLPAFHFLGLYPLSVLTLPFLLQDIALELNLKESTWLT